MNKKIKVLILVYLILISVICLIYTPYVEYTWLDSSQGYEFTGYRGNSSLYQFNEIQPPNTQYLYVYYIDFQVLFVEILVVTVIFIGLYIIVLKKGGDIE